MARHKGEKGKHNDYLGKQQGGATYSLGESQKKHQRRGSCDPPSGKERLKKQTEKADDGEKRVPS